MVDPRKLSPEDAKKMLIKQVDTRRNRQREYRKRAAAEGRAKVNTYLSVEASEVLEHCKEALNMGVSDALNEALLCYRDQEYGMKLPPLSSTPRRRVVAPVAPRELLDAGWTPFDEAMIQERIKGILDEDNEIGPVAIAQQLTNEKYLTATGRQEWSHGSVSKIIKKTGLRD